jgi:hypothetical protein
VSNAALETRTHPRKSAMPDTLNQAAAVRDVQPKYSAPARTTEAANLDRMLHVWQSSFIAGRSPSTVALALLDWAVEADGHQAAAIRHQRLGERCHTQERIAGDVDRQGEARGAAIDDAAIQILRPREGDRVQQKVESSPFRSDPLEDRFELSRNAYVGRQQQRAAEGIGDRPNIGQPLVVQLGRRDLGDRGYERTRAVSGDAGLVGDAAAARYRR